MKNIIQNTLNKIIETLSENEELFSLESYKKIKSIKSGKSVAEIFGINVSMLSEFEIATADFYKFKDDRHKEKIVSFRLALWLETICKNLNIPFNIDELISNQELAIKQVRALELIIRDVVNDNLGGKDNVLLKLQELFKQEIVEKWLKNGDESGVLSGTTFSELSSVFLDKNIFRGLQDIFDSEGMNLNGDSRDTLRKILDDIRIIRNSVAHNKQVSNIQIEALNEYYRTIAHLIKESKLNNVNPDSYLDLDKSNMEEFILQLKEDNKEISGNLESIKKSIDEGFSRLNEKTEIIHETLKSKWISKKFLVLYTILIALVVLLTTSYILFIKREINTKIQLSWLSENASYKFQELDKISIKTGGYKNDFFVNSDGVIDLIGIPAENLDLPLIISFKNSKIYQIDKPKIVRDAIIPITISIKDLDLVKFSIRDLETGKPINGAQIHFSNLSSITNELGKADVRIPNDKISKFINIEILRDGYKYFKLNDVMVNSSIPIEILLEK
jgi:hypothetical protein